MTTLQRAKHSLRLAAAAFRIDPQLATMFQVVADRAEKAAVIVTTNLPFSQWSQVIPNPRLCKALIDRLTDQAHIITTGADSYRFRRTATQRKTGRTGGQA